MSNKASAGCLPAPHETPIATSVPCCKLLPDLPGLWPSLSSRLGQSGSNDWERNCFSRGFGEWDWTSTNMACTGLWLLRKLNLGGWRGSDRDNGSHCLFSQEALLHIAFREIDSGAVGVCSKATASCDYFGRPGQSHPSFLINNACCGVQHCHGGLCALIPQGRSMEVTTTVHFRAEMVCGQEDALMWFLVLIGVDGWDPQCSGR